MSSVLAFQLSLVFQATDFNRNIVSKFLLTRVSQSGNIVSIGFLMGPRLPHFEETRFEPAQNKQGSKVIAFEPR